MNFDKDFVMDFFLDDTVSTLNKVVVAVANVVNENNENTSCFDELLIKEQSTHIIREQKQKVKKKSDVTGVKAYFENFVVKFTDEDYLEKYQMKKSTVQALINCLKEFQSGCTIIPLEKKVHIFLWILTSDYSFSETGVLFGLHKSSISYIFYEIASILTEQQYNYINWPSIKEQHMTRVKVNSRYKFPNCVGFIDACRLKVGSKKHRKNVSETILLQAVCDESLSFLDVHLGKIGDTRKSRVFRQSQLSKELKNFIDFENHILGDSNYRLRKNLITPFTSEELLTSEEMKFNEVHWKTRSYIGHAFELLRRRFKKLNHLDVNKQESNDTIILASCVLHNFVILHEGCSEIKHEPVICDDHIIIDREIVKTAIEKRQYLCNYINYLDSS
ncbi:protein ANTAGONIST OF LIKE HETEROCHROMATIN PROTEIN 1 [Papilio machaon]|uniref:protein ANTAGONIST OF LIKE HETEROCHROMATIN PROTEIN 1 n=1 Tax=Papilio machaon TaxID=76193 RepID=UPI001E6635F1|nr:protein ANTAGONIST OF LIKE HETEROCHROMATIN PROTEIN 1 [Papilio machaon]